MMAKSNVFSHERYEYALVITFTSALRWLFSDLSFVDLLSSLTPKICVGGCSIVFA